jgi:hypothetical protein
VNLSQDLVKIETNISRILFCCILTISIGDLCGSVFLDYRFESYIREKIGEKTINSMKPRSKIEMMSSWEQKVKFIFGNTPGLEGFEVNLQGVKNDRRKNIEDCFHTMQMYFSGVSFYHDNFAKPSYLKIHLGKMLRQYLIQL